MKPSGLGCVLPHFVRRYRSFSCDLFDVGSSFNALPVDISIIEAGWVEPSEILGKNGTIMWKFIMKRRIFFWVVFRWDISGLQPVTGVGTLKP